jgi:hypothetical protein
MINRAAKPSGLSWGVSLHPMVVSTSKPHDSFALRLKRSWCIPVPNWDTNLQGAP